MTEADLVKGRRHAIYALVVFCAVFFLGGIVLSYIVAASYGYGTGFGDGRPEPVKVAQGHGFFGDGAILAGSFFFDGAVVFAWYWLISRLEAPASDDPLPVDDGADLSRDENWYFIPVPRLTKVLTGVAVLCTIGVALLASSNLPIVLLRFGW
jgi:hypothetical protein